jgi:hypothetical protein
VIEIGSAVGSKNDLLAHIGQAPQIPASASKAALRILSRRSPQRERIELQFDTAPNEGIGKAAAIIDFWQSDRDAALNDTVA